jgi:hypothetical protein
MVASESRRRGCKPGDLLRIGVEGTALYRTTHAKDEFDVVGFLNEDDVVHVVSARGGMIRVFTKLGVGWVHIDNLADIFD